MTVDDFITRVADAIVNPLLLLMFSWAFLMFVWGAFQFVYQADDSEARDKGKQHLIWGVVGMFIMVAAEGIIGIIRATVGSF